MMASTSEPATGLSILDHLRGLLQVNPAVDALEQHDVDFFQQFRNRVDDLDAHFADLLRETLDAILA
jgi:hypothetical protein